jgi:small subunit ribosomal protein S7
MKYQSVKVTKLINYSMIDGKRSVAEKHIYDAFDIIQSRTKRNPMDVYEDVLRSVAPQVEVRSRRVGGSSYQVPMPVTPHRQFSLAIRWIVQEARKRSNSGYHTFAEKLAAEMMDILKSEGGAMQKRMLVHRAAEANKAFAHFRW